LPRSPLGLSGKPAGCGAPGFFLTFLNYGQPVLCWRKERMNMICLRAGTLDGVARLQLENGSGSLLDRTLPGEDVVVLTHAPGDPDILFAGTYGRGLFRTRDGGKNWKKLPLEMEYIRSIAFDPETGRKIYVGSEPAYLHCSEDGGESWMDLGIRKLPESAEWSLPYSPRSGALRSLAMGPGGLIYGAVEQGGVLISKDGGARWTITHDGVHPDVHWLSRHPFDASILCAATGGGVFQTKDGGQTWKQLFDDYTRAVLMLPRNPEIIFAGPAEEVGERGRIVMSDNGGKEWKVASQGLDLPLTDMVEHFVTHELVPDKLFAVLSEGGLIQTSLERMEWRRFEPKIQSVQCIDLAERGKE
jgi:photosystem II stability/assembly factor-like uncharacterized protein